MALACGTAIYRSNAARTTGMTGFFGDRCRSFEVRIETSHRALVALELFRME
jgi:hypothetical protein